MPRAFKNVPASSTDYQIVPGVSGKKIQVHSLFCMAGGTATTITFNSKLGGGSGVAGTAITPQIQNGANGGAVLSQGGPWMETTAGHDLTCTTGSGSATAVIVNYSLIDE